MQSVCTLFYNAVRPLVIQEIDLDTLCEVLSIMKYQVSLSQQLDENENSSSSSSAASTAVTQADVATAAATNAEPNVSYESTAALVEMLHRLMSDAQERLAYRAQVYIREQIANYVNTPDDLNYPNKLLSGKNGQPIPATPAAALSAASAAPIATSSESGVFASWHPIVSRTLMCLSKLYRCVEINVFKYIAQHGIMVCTTGLMHAKNAIQANTHAVGHT